jgi:hypothetical protein
MDSGHKHRGITSSSTKASKKLTPPEVDVIKKYDFLEPLSVQPVLQRGENSISHIRHVGDTLMPVARPSWPAPVIGIHNNTVPYPCSPQILLEAQQ